MKPNLIIILILTHSFTMAKTQVVDSDREHKTEMEFVRIACGKFRMGDEVNPSAEYVDNYAHDVSVDSFYLGRYEVTNAQYLEFCKATDHKLPEFWGFDVYCSGPEFPNHPVVGITWADASQFAQWKGCRLPTEAEWEYAARGGLAGKNYPNGQEMDPAKGNYNGTQGHPLEVGSFSPNAFGLYDMSGNVLEWVSDFYDKDYFLESPENNPTGPPVGKRKVIRGGGWRSGKMCTTVHFRQSLRPYWVDFNVGFRCAKDL